MPSPLARAHSARRFAHRLAVLVERCVRVEGHERGERFDHRVRGHDPDRAPGELVDLLGDSHDVLVL